MTAPTLAIRGGLVFDGLGSTPRRADVLVDAGTIADVVDPGAPLPEHARVIDAKA